MENLVLRYNRTTMAILDDGSTREYLDDVSGYTKKEKDDSLAKTAEMIRDSRYCVTTYQELLEKFYTDKKLKLAKLYDNYIVGDYLVVLRKVLKTDMRYFVSYKFENDEIKQIIYELLGGRDHMKTIAARMNDFNWIGTPEAIEVMLAAAMLDHTDEIKFEQHQKRKKNGKVRIYYAPNDAIKKPLQKLNRVLQRIYDGKNATFQVAYKHGKSVYDNAAIHKNKKYVFNIDLKDFYPSCKRPIVRKYLNVLFRSAPFRDKLVDAFMDIILIDDGLFIGNPISGCLANAVLNKPVLYIKHMCDKHDMGFSVYADDMSFSSDKFISEKYVKAMFADAFTTYGLDSYFTLNDEKSIGYTGCNRKVTGVSINQNNDVTVSRRYYRTLRAMIANLANGDNTIDIKQLQGKLAYATMIDDSGKIYRYLLKFEDTVRQYSLCSDKKMDELKLKFEGRI